jgi:hypothetical protein
MSASVAERNDNQRFLELETTDIITFIAMFTKWTITSLRMLDLEHPERHHISKFLLTAQKKISK